MIRPAMLLTVAALAGCATSAPVTQIKLVHEHVPPALLICQPAPLVPAATTQAQVADYIVRLWIAGQDCRNHLISVRGLLQPKEDVTTPKG